MIYSCHTYLRTKIVIKTIEISLKISGQIRPSSKSNSDLIKNIRWNSTAFDLHLKASLIQCNK